MNSFLKGQVDFSGASRRSSVRAEKRLESNMAGGVSLNFVLILLYFCICLIGAIASIFLSTVTMGLPFSDSIDFADISAAVISLLLMVMLISPLRLSIKGWYRRLSVSQTPLILAFSSFTSARRYFTALGFCFFKLIISLAIGLVSLAPSAFLFGVSSGIFDNANALDEYSAWFLLFGIILFVAGIVFILYTMLCFFYADYIYLDGKMKNPFKIYSLSFSLFIRHKGLLFRAVMSAMPYILLMLLIVSIPFCVVKIKAVFAAHAGTVLSMANA